MTIRPAARATTPAETEQTSWRNTIIVGDASHLLRVLPRAVGPVPLILFSPPYNLGTTTGGGFPGKGGAAGKWGGGALSEGYDGTDDAMPQPVYMAWLADVLDAAWQALSDDGAIYMNHKPRILGGVLLSALDYVPAHLRRYVRQEIVWARAGGVNFSASFYVPTSERIVVIARPAWRLKSKGASGAGDVWTISQQAGTWHPAPFPLALAERVLETTGAALVIDPFMGSGTTGRAARRLGVPWIGFERSARYAAQAMRDIENTMPYSSATRDLFDQMDGLLETTP